MIREVIGPVSRLLAVIVLGLTVACGRLKEPTVGTVLEKRESAKGYVLVVKAYGKFLVTKKEYEQIEVGDKLPKFLIERGQ